MTGNTRSREQVKRSHKPGWDENILHDFFYLDIYTRISGYTQKNEYVGNIAMQYEGWIFCVDMVYKFMERYFRNLYNFNQ